MKILKFGKIQSPIYIGKCNKCSAIVEANESELNIQSGGFCNGNDDFAWADCPDCGTNKKICFHSEDTKISKTILSELKEFG